MRAVWLVLALMATSGPTFTKVSTGVNTSGFLVVSFTEVGLTPGSSVTYTLTADSTAQWNCLSGSGKHATTLSSPTVTQTGESVTVTKTVSSKGSVQGGAALPAAGWPGSNVCSSGGSPVLISVTYSNIVLADTTNGVSRDLSTASKNLPGS